MAIKSLGYSVVLCVLVSLTLQAGAFAQGDPVITINGPENTPWECTVPYEDWGATAFDPVDGDITRNIQVTGIYSINTTILGSVWPVTYSVTNSRGTTVYAQRIVAIVDFTNPIISLNSWEGKSGQNYPNPDYGIISGTYTMPEWLVTLRAEDPVLYNQLAYYLPTNFAGDIYWILKPADWSDDRAIHWNCPIDYVEPGIVVSDACEGSLDEDEALVLLMRVNNDNSLTLVRNSGEIVGGRLGDVKENFPTLANPVLSQGTDNPFKGYRLYIFTEDGEFNSAINARDILPYYIVYIELAGEPTITIDCNQSFENIYFWERQDRAFSPCLGDLSHLIIATGEVDITTPGSYRRNYDIAAGSAGLSLINPPERTIIVRDSAPVITLFNEFGAPVNDAGAAVSLPWCTFLEFDGATFEQQVTNWAASWWVRKPGQGFYTTDLCDGDDFVTDRTSVLGITTIVNALRQLALTRDASLVGQYPVIYNAVDSRDNKAVTRTRMVNLVYEPPVLTIAPPAVVVTPHVTYSLDVECGMPVTLPAASISEGLCNLQFNAIPVNFGGLNINDPQPGEYTVLYSSASHGTALTAEVNLIVTVVDKAPPVIEVLGYEPPLVVGGDGIIDLDCQMLEGMSIASLVYYSALDACEGDLTDEVIATVDTVDAKAVDADEDKADETLFIVRLSVADSEGNIGRQSSAPFRIVNSLPPVLAIQSVPAALECGSNVNFAYTGTDACGTDITPLVDVCVVPRGSAPPDCLTLEQVRRLIGDYTAIFNLTDAWGNVAAEVRRDFSVVDSGNPIITLMDPAPEYADEENRLLVNCGTLWDDSLEPGYSATDNCDSGDLTSLVVVDSSAVDTAVPGIYPVVYSVTDSEGNTAEETRSVVVTSLTPPVITLTPSGLEVSGVLQAQCDTAGVWVEPGFTAVDVCVGTLDEEDVEVFVWAYNRNTGALVLPQLPETSFTFENGLVPRNRNQNYLFIYVAHYADGKTEPPLDEDGRPLIYTEEDGVLVVDNWQASYLRRVQIVDTTPPEVTLLGEQEVVIYLGDVYEELGATAFDACDGDVTESIEIGNDFVDTNRLGTYKVSYTARDAANNQGTEERTVRVADPSEPVITLIGAASITQECGGEFADPGATALDAIDGDLTDAITVKVDPNMMYVPGEYTVTYSVVNSRGSIAERGRTVTTVDTTAPVITLRGANSITVDCGDPLFILDEYAIAADLCDIRPVVTRIGDVDANTAGTYTVQYSATDSAGNSVQAALTVTVDNCPDVEEGELEGEGEGENEGEGEGEPEECTGCRACLGCCPNEEGKWLPKDWLGDWLLIGLSMLVLAAFATSRHDR
jgi:hypothetical protein